MKKAALLAALMIVTTPVPAAVPVQPPKLDEARAPGSATAVLAGGCFWGMEGVFEHVAGVRDVVSGYAGGNPRDANYRAVSTERTGHAEAIRISYDPARISYGQILRIYFSVAHDPTQVNRQGPDTGPSYRSAIFPQTPRQRQIAAAYIRQLNGSRVFQRPIATRLESGSFTPAEAFHQGFMRKHPDHPYIRINDAPKLADLKRLFPTLWRA